MKINEIPSSQINEFKNENVILFVGSGMSCNANLPQWSELLDKLKSGLLEPDKEESDFFEGLDYIQKAQFLYDKTDKAVVINKINDIFDRSFEDSRLHKLLVTLPCKIVITTNWDNLLELSYNEIKTKVDVVWKDEQLPLKTSPNILLKLHGSLADPHSVIFSEEDYYTSINHNSLLMQYISLLVATSSILFIGYSYSDFDFKLIANSVMNKLKSLKRQPYIFLPNANRVNAGYLEKRGMIPIIFLDKNEKRATNKFLKLLSGMVSNTAIDPIDRLKILDRENSAFLENKTKLLIRNQANLGPLATPDIPQNLSLFGNTKRTQLEIKCASTWRQLLKNGAKAKCILCIKIGTLLEMYSPDDVMERLQVLRQNIMVFNNEIEVVDLGESVRINLDIYGREVALESIKVGYRIKSYNKLIVMRNSKKINTLIDDFDKSFIDIKNNNLSSAKIAFPNHGGTEKELLHDYILSRIDSAIDEIKGI